METHAILAVALPAVLPPPMPLSPFVLAAGALKMSRNKFLITFTVSRFLRHAAFAAARRLLRPPRPAHVEQVQPQVGGTEILIAVWSIILISVGIAFWKLYKTSRTVSAGKPHSTPTAPPAEA